MFIGRFSTQPISSYDLENDCDFSLNIWLTTCFWHSFWWVRLAGGIPLLVSQCILAGVLSLHFVDWYSREVVWFKYDNNFWGHACLHWHRSVAKLKSSRPLWVLVSLVLLERCSLYSTIDLDGAVFMHVDSLICCFHIVLTGLTYTHYINKGFALLFFLQVKEKYFYCVQEFFFVSVCCLILYTVHHLVLNDIKANDRTWLLVAFRHQHRYYQLFIISSQFKTHLKPTNIWHFCSIGGFNLQRVKWVK